MQSLVISPSPLATNHFGQIRFNSGSLSLNLGRSTNAQGHRALVSPPPCFMSGPPAAGYPLKTSKEPRHPERPGFLHVVTTCEEPAATPASSSNIGDSTSQERFPASETLSYPQNAPIFDEHSASQSVVFPYATTKALVCPPRPTDRILAQKQTRRAKAHVASACVNCKKKHLGCDSTRPCRRCVVAGKASTCVDVTHKKRGRPPLKADEISPKLYAGQLSNPATSAELQLMAAQPTTTTTAQPKHNHGHRATSPREIRPITDLQASQGGPGYLQRWSWSFPFQTTQGASPSTIESLGRRPVSSDSLHQQTIAPAFPSSIGGFSSSPADPSHHSPTTIAAGTGIQPSPFPGRSMIPPLTSPPQHQRPPMGDPISPYSNRFRAPAPVGWPSMSESPQSRHGDCCESYPRSPVKLPPISPTFTSGGPSPSHHAFRLSDPYPASTFSWPHRSHDVFRREGPVQAQSQTRPSPQTGAVESISPRTQFYRPLPHDPVHGPVGSLPGHGVAITPIPGSAYLGQPFSAAPAPVPDTITGDTSTGAGGERPKAQSDSSDPRPVKRHKMSVHDIVND